jgi:chitinase
MNDPGPTFNTFSQLAESVENQARFSASLLSFMATYGFDGVDIDWSVRILSSFAIVDMLRLQYFARFREYPVAPERGGNPADFKNYASWLRGLKTSFQASGHNYGLSLTLPSSYWYLQHFDIVSLSAIVDWFNIMTYDLHGTWDSTDIWIGAITQAHTNLTEIDQALQLLWRNNIDPRKVVLGLGFYGRSFTLSDPSCSNPGCPFTSGAAAGPCTDSVGTLSYAEIERIVAAGAPSTLDSPAAVKKVVYGNNQWVSFDDAETFKMKVDFANSLCLEGTMVWAVSLDDAQGTAAAALSRSTGRQVKSLEAVQKSQDPVTACQWSACGDRWELSR